MGIVLMKDSLLVLRHNPGLAWFPVVSGLAGLTFLVLFLGVIFGLIAISPEGGALVGLFVAYLVLTFISSLFTAGLVHQTRAVLDGGDPSLKVGLRAAWERKGPLFVWSMIAATVGVLINSLENSNSRAGQIFGLLFSVAWTLMTFFIIPIIVFERTSTMEMFKQSARKFKQTYGETPISLVGLQLISFIVALPFILIGIALFSSGLAILGAAAIITGLALSFIISQTLQGIVKTALYIYAEEGKKPSEFDNVDFNEMNKEESTGFTSTPKTRGGFH